MRALPDQFRTNALGYSEIEYFYGPPTSQKQIRWLDVSMNDSGGMGRLQGLRNLNPNAKDFLSREARTGHALLQSFALEEFDGNEMQTFRFVNLVNRTNVRVIQRRGGLGFSLKSPKCHFVASQILRKQLKSHATPECQI